MSTRYGRGPTRPQLREKLVEAAVDYSHVETTDADAKLRHNSVPNKARIWRGGNNTRGCRRSKALPRPRTLQLSWIFEALLSAGKIK